MDDDAYMTQMEESMLDYVGVEGVIGMYYRNYHIIEFFYIFKYTYIYVTQW